jgi:hypothetical protein
VARRKRRPNPQRIRAQYLLDVKACIEKEKHRYLSEDDALGMIRKIAKARPKEGPLKCYKCSHCGYWHLAKALPKS